MRVPSGQCPFRDSNQSEYVEVLILPLAMRDGGIEYFQYGGTLLFQQADENRSRPPRTMSRGPLAPDDSGLDREAFGAGT